MCLLPISVQSEREDVVSCHTRLSQPVSSTIRTDDCYVNLRLDLGTLVGTGQPTNDGAIRWMSPTRSAPRLVVLNRHGPGPTAQGLEGTVPLTLCGEIPW